MVLEYGVKNIKATAYNGARTVFQYEYLFFFKSIEVWYYFKMEVWYLYVKESYAFNQIHNSILKLYQIKGRMKTNNITRRSN